MKVIVLVLGMAITLGVAYFYIRGQAGPGGAAQSAPKQTLENVRGAATRIEADMAARAANPGGSNVAEPAEPPP